MTITIRTVIREEDGGREEACYRYTGTYRETGGAGTLTYCRREEDGTLSRAVLSFARQAADTVTLRESGGAESTMRFTVGAETAGVYRLPGIGEIPFRIRTLSLENRLSPSEGTLALVYHQTFGGARRQVEMTLTLSREEENHADP